MSETVLHLEGLTSIEAVEIDLRRSQKVRIGAKNGREDGAKSLKTWWPGTELNRRRQPFQGCALPPELPGHILNAAAGSGHSSLCADCDGISRPNWTASARKRVERVNYNNSTDFPQRADPLFFTFFRAFFSRSLRRETLRAMSMPRNFSQTPPGSQSYARRPFRDPGFLIFGPSRAGDIEVNPWRIFREFFQEHGCGDGAAPASAGVLDVGDGGPDLLFIFVVKRQTPHFFAALSIRGMEAVVHFVVVGESSSIDHAQSDHDMRRSGWRRPQVRAPSWRA